MAGFGLASFVHLLAGAYVMAFASSFIAIAYFLITTAVDPKRSGDGR